MSIIVNLPAELEKTIAAEAAKAGMTVSDYVAGRLKVEPLELIDTDVLIDVQRGFGAAADWFAMDPDVGVPGFCGDGARAGRPQF